MNAGRTWAIALKVLRSLRRDKRSLALILVGPMLSILAFGFVFGTDLANLRVVVVDLDHGDAAAQFLDELDSDLLDVEYEPSERRAIDRVEAGDAWAAIIVPPGFSEAMQEASHTPPSALPLPLPPLPNPSLGPSTNVASGSTGSPETGSSDPQARLILDGSNAQVVEAVQQEVRRALSGVDDRADAGPAATSTIIYAEGAKFIDFFVPGIMSFSVFIFTTLLTVLAFVQERTGGTLARLQAGPTRDSEIVLGNAIAFGGIATVQVSILFVLAVLVFDVQVEGSFLLGIAIVVLLGITSQALGILLSAAARREAQAVQFMPLLVVPTLLLGGIFLPIESLPGWLRPLSFLVPPTWSTEGLRSVLLRGWGLDRIWPDLVALAGFAVGFLTLAVALLGRQRR